MRFPAIISLPCVILCALLLAPDRTMSAERPTLEKVTSIITTGGDGNRPTRQATSEIAVADAVLYIVTVRWEPIDKGAGRRKVRWVWYKDGRAISEIKQTHNFKPTPFELWARNSGTAFGPGQGKVELYIDNQLFDSQEFEIKP